MAKLKQIKSKAAGSSAKFAVRVIGDPKAVEEFVSMTLNNVLGVQVTRDRKGYRIVTGNPHHPCVNCCRPEIQST